MTSRFPSSPHAHSHSTQGPDTLIPLCSEEGFTKPPSLANMPDGAFTLDSWEEVEAFMKQHGMYSELAQMSKTYKTMTGEAVDSRVLYQSGTILVTKGRLPEFCGSKVLWEFMTRMEGWPKKGEEQEMWSND